MRVEVAQAAAEHRHWRGEEGAGTGEREQEERREEGDEVSGTIDFRLSRVEL